MSFGLCLLSLPLNVGFSTSICSWSVHTRVLPSNGVLCVRRFESLHTCGAAVRTYRNSRTKSELVFDVITDRVRA
ncbi:hypothetical protein ACSBR2_009536 [Camellia fascicularis]